MRRATRFNIRICIPAPWMPTKSSLASKGFVGCTMLPCFTDRYMNTGNEKGREHDARGLEASTILIVYETVICRGLTCSAFGRVNVTRP